jgi:glyoxylase I family protein
MSGAGVTEGAASPALAVRTPAGGPHIALTVRDPRAVAAWWCRTLGFVELNGVSQRLEAGPTPRTLVRHPDSGLIIGFRQPPTGSRTGPAGRISLRVASRSALDDWAAHLDELGVAHSAVRDNGSALYLSLVAPDGIGLELWWPRPLSTRPAEPAQLNPPS